MPRPNTPRSLRSTTRQALMRSTMLAATLGLLATAAHAQTLPTGGKVIAGTAGITTGGSTTTISQSSDKAIIDWSAFSIGQGGTVQFNNGSGATLNRVTGGSLSSIDGLLSATGSVYLVNPNGVIIGKSGVVKVGGGFVASTLDIDNANFLNGGDQTLVGTSLASVVNLGKIGALGGDVALVAANVRNDGTVVAPNGTLGLLAGSRVLMRDTALNDGKFLVLAGGAGTSATNTGTIEAATAELRAEGGNVYALAGNTTGLIRATGVSANDGRIFLTAGDDGSVTVSGSVLKASDAAGNGGLISISERQVAVAADAVLDASATSATGQGGKVSVIAGMTSGALSFHGTALAKGGANGGDGGFVETSGHTVDFDGAQIDTSATGRSGTWLIDPYDLTVTASAASTIAGNLANNDVTLQTTANGTSGLGTQTSGNGDIVINSDITWSSNHTLTLDAYHSIQVNANLTVQSNGGVVLRTNDNGGSGGDYAFAFGKSLSYTGSGGSLNINGQGYTLLYSLADFPQMESSMSNFALAKPIDATGLVYGQAVVHGYSSNSTYAGVFTGLGNTISNLTVSTGGEWASLFAFSSGTIRDIGIVGGSFNAYTDAGALVSYNYGTIINAWTSSSVNVFVSGGGLVDVNNGTIRNSFSTGNVNGVSGIGGLAANNSGSISNSYSTATVTNTITQGGGLIAYNNGAVTNSYAAGKVNGAGAQGGLIGQYNAGAITNSYYDITATGENDTGKGVGVDLTNGTLPTGFAGAGWSVTAGLYPYLTSVGLQTITGHAYTGNGAAANGATLALYAGGIHLDAETATSGADGSYTLTTMPGVTQAGVVETLSGASSAGGLAYNDHLLGNTLDVTSGAMQYATQGTSYATLKSNAAATFGTSAYATLLTTLGGTSYDVDATGAFTLDSGLETPGPVVIKTLGGNLTVSNDLTLSGTTALTLDASANLAIDGNLTAAGTNAVTLKTGAGGDYTFALGKTLGFTGSNGTLTINGNSYVLLNSVDDLATMNLGAGQYYALNANTTSSSSYAGNVVTGTFNGTFTGLGHTITNLNITNITGTSTAAGLFNTLSSSATVRDLGLVGGTVQGEDAGAIAGVSNGMIRNVWSSATVIGSNYAGGLVGGNNGTATITNSFDTGAITGSVAGGLAGNNGGLISNSYTIASVSTPNDAAGGLVGYLVGGTIINSYAAGAEYRSSNNLTISGLVAMNSAGTVTNSYYDITSRASTEDIGMGTGQTTAQLQGTLPSGFSSTAWGTSGGLYPYLKTFFPNAPFVVSGIASDSQNAAAAGATINLYSGGSLQGSAIAAANGAYYFALPLTAAGTGAGLTETLKGASTVSGAGFGDTGNLIYGGVGGLNVASGAFNEYTAQSSYAAVKAEAASSFGASAYATLLTSLSSSPFNIYASSWGFTVDSNFDTTSPILVKGLNGNLTVTADLTIGGSTALTLDAHNALYINGNITASGANAVTLISGDSGYGDYSFAYGKSLSFTGSNGSLVINGNTYALISSMSALATLNNATGHYALAKSLDASGTPYTASIIGIFGNSGSQNAGTLTGLGNTINNLTINGTGNTIGLIGTNYGVVRDLGLVNVNLTTTGTGIGAFAGLNANGTLQNDYVSGTVHGTASVGGLAGASNLTVTNVFSSATVSGQSDVGGLVGIANSGTISGAYNLGAVAGTSVVGGIAGLNAGATISAVFSAGLISGSDHAGGVVGQATGGYTYSAYYDNQTSGVSDNGSGYGMSTSQLKGGSMGMMFGQNWSGTRGLYPYLTTFGLQTLGGYAYTGSGSAAASATVGLYSGGNLLGSVTSSADGAYSMTVLPGTLGIGELGITETLNGASSATGMAFTDAFKTSANVTAGNWQYTTIATSYGALTTEAASTFGTSTYTGLTTALGGANTAITAANGFAFDQAVTFGGDLSVTAAGGISLANALTTSGSATFNSAVTLAGNAAVQASGALTFGSSVDGGYDLTLSGAGLTFDGAVGGASRLASLSGTATGGDIDVNGQIKTSGNIFLAANGDFVNTAGSTALGAGGHFIVYTQDSADPTGVLPTDTFDGLTATNYYNDAYDFTGKSFASTVPTTGDYFVYGYTARLTPTLSGSASKTYDGGTTAATSGLTIGSTLLSIQDSVLFAIADASFDTKNADSHKTVTANGISLSSNPNNYILASTTASAAIGTISQASLTASLIGTVSKTYDTNTTASLTADNYKLTGVITGDSVTLSDPTAGTYDTKNAATGKTVTVSGLTLSGGDSGNYALDSATISGAIGTINQASLTASLIGATSKTYDANTTAALTADNYKLAGVITGDSVTLSDPTSGTYDTKNAATGKTVTVSGLTLSGGDSANYALDSATISGAIGTIKQASLTASLIGATSKTYDANTTATLTTDNYKLTGVVTGDNVSLSDPTAGTYDTKNAATGKTVTVSGLTLSGGDSANYALDSATISGAIGTINQASLTASLTGTTSKTYDANTTASLTADNYKLAGVITGDSVTLSDPTSGIYDTKNAATGKTVTVSGLTLSGGDSANYALNAATISGAIGTIKQASLTASLTGTTSKTYDANTTATLTAGNYKLTGVITGDNVSLSDPTAGTYDTKNAATGKTVTVSGLTLSGGDSANYALDSATISGAIGTINQASLTASLTGTISKTYDANTTATLTADNYKLAGVITGDSVTLSDPTSGTYDTKNAATGKTVTVSGLTLSGGDSTNYALNAATISGAIGTIKQASLTASLTGTTSKTYDANTTATLTAGNYKLTGVITGDNVSLSDPTAGTFDTKNAATGKTVTVSGLTLSGNDSANYALNSATISAAIGTISQASLTASLIGATSKTYDANTTATLTAGNYKLTGVITGDSVTLSDPTSGTYDTKNAASNKTVTVSGLTLSGNDSANYALNAATISAAIGTINQASLTASLTGTVSKTYDATVTATLASTNYSLTGLITGDDVGISAASAVYSDKTAVSGKTVTASGLSLSGADGGNYALVSTSLSAKIGTINKAPVTISLTGSSSKVYDGTTKNAPLTSGNYLISGVVTGDTVTFTPSTTGTYDTANVGTGKTVTTSISRITGADATNYALTSTSVTGTIGIITPAQATVTTTSAAQTNVVIASAPASSGTSSSASTGSTTSSSGSSTTSSPSGTTSSSSGTSSSSSGSTSTSSGSQSTTGCSSGCDTPYPSNQLISSSISFTTP